MLAQLKRHLPWLAGWLLLSAVGATWIVQTEFAQVRQTVEAQSRTVHRALSQRATQNDAVLVTLLTGRPTADGARPDTKPPAPYPHIVAVQTRSGEATWSQPSWGAAEAESRKLRRPVVADPNLARGRYQLILAGDASAQAVTVDLRGMIPWNEWPMAPDASPVRVVLAWAGQSYVVQPGRVDDSGVWRMRLAEPLASDSQPFELTVERELAWGELPWAALLSWSLLVAVLLLVARALLRQRADRRRAQELLRLGQVERQALLGELATGIAQELEKPLEQALVNALAAQRVLDEDPPDLLTAQLAVREAAAQARLAAENVRVLRHVANQPTPGVLIQIVDPLKATRRALDLLEPETRRRGVQPDLRLEGPEFRVRADPSGLEQILHCLLLNALQALDQVQISDRRLQVVLSTRDEAGQIAVRDSGPGMASDVLPHVFKPFFTTRDGALGLGLTHSESLAQGMGGNLMAFNQSPRGSEFCLSLPLASLP